MSVSENLKKLVKEVSARYKELRGHKGVLEEPYQELKKSEPIDKAGKFRRIAGISTIDLSWFLFLLGKYSLKDLNTIFLDNEIIDKLKEKKKNIKTNISDSEFKKFFDKLQKTHPAAAARLHLWMVYSLFAGLTVGGIKAANYNDTNSYDENSTTGEIMEDVLPDSEEIVEQNTQIDFVSFKENLKPVVPWMVLTLIAEEGMHVNENGLHVPYFDTKGNRWTIGFGSTVLKNGKKVTKNTPPITTKQAWDLACWHIEEKEVFPMLYWYYVYDNDLMLKTVGEVVGMGSVIFNASNKLIEDKDDRNNKERSTLLRRAARSHNLSDSLILYCFDKYPIVKTNSFGENWFNHSDKRTLANSLGGFCREGGGIYWRRWLEAGLISGDLSPADLLECPYNGMADFFKYMGGYKKNDSERRTALWQHTKNGWETKNPTYNDFKKWLENPKTKDAKGREGTIKRKKLKDMLPPEVLNGLINSDYINSEEIQYAAKDNDSKITAFNKGIKKIKDKQSIHNDSVYDSTNDHLA